MDFTTNIGAEDTVLDFFVENMGRVNFGSQASFKQRKGLHEGQIQLDGLDLTGWTIYPLEFTKAWVNR